MAIQKGTKALWAKDLQQSKNLLLPSYPDLENGTILKGSLQRKIFIFESDPIICPDFESAIIFLIPHTVSILQQFKVCFRLQNLLKKNYLIRSL